MNPRRFASLVVSLALLGGAVVAPAAPAAKAKPPGGKPTDHSAHTKEHIEALFRFRLKPEPLPADLPNPFQLAAGPAAPAEPGPLVRTAEPVATGSDQEALARYSGSLKISGIVYLNGQAHLVINESPYKVGDFFFLKNKDAVVYLRVIHIAPGELTVGLNDAEQTITYKQ